MKLKNTEYGEMLINNHLPPFTNYEELSRNGVRIISKASGNYIYDAVSLIEQKIITEDTGFFTEEIGLDLTENIQKINIYPKKANYRFWKRNFFLWI
mgnify:CR=1 FL=1